MSYVQRSKLSRHDLSLPSHFLSQTHGVGLSTSRCFHCAKNVDFASSAANVLQWQQKTNLTSCVSLSRGYRASRSTCFDSVFG